MPNLPNRSPRARVAVVALVAACATSGSPGAAAPTNVTPPQPTTRIESAGGTYEVRLSPDDRAVDAVFAAAGDKVWAALPFAYDSLDIKLTAMSAATRSLGVQNARIRRRLAGQVISRSLSCGMGVSGENNADSYDVSLTVMSAVEPSAGDRAVLRTWVQATARPIGVSGDPVRCATTGWLERRIAQLVAARLAA